ncbi:macrophage migration inhibitory factor [Moniliophthora roreri]|nr:macrophage migration inhibitory factor [Moniliophthora roreri]
MAVKAVLEPGSVPPPGEEEGLFSIFIVKPGLTITPKQSGLSDLSSFTDHPIHRLH